MKNRVTGTASIAAAILFAAAGFSLCGAASAADYGVDCSFPIHSKEFQCGNLLGDRKKLYEEFMEGCRQKYGNKGHYCDSEEDSRIEMSRRQPQSMVNYTSTGFKKIRAPKELMDLLMGHWETNKHRAEPEVWSKGNIYTNHWAAPTFMVSVEDDNLEGAGTDLKNRIWEAARPTIEEWTGMELQPSSMYGVRMYTENAILNPHVDRMPLVSSCIINVAQDVDEPWPLEVYDRHDRAVNVTMEPGDMVLYESGSLMHGRPFPLKGRYYANIFIHFEPTGRPLNDTTNAYLDTLDDFWPPYLMPNSPELEVWASWNPRGWRKPSPSAPQQKYQPLDAHGAAAFGEVDYLKEMAAKDRATLLKRDVNGWTPAHEAARAGEVEAMRFLIEHGGAEINARTGVHSKGSSLLNLALLHNSIGHPIAQYLLEVGAEDVGPEDQ